MQIATQELSGRKPNELGSLFGKSLFAEPNPSTYSVYDVTTFSEEHPGIDLTEMAAIEDATTWFELNAHSDHAVMMLRTLAVPGLTNLEYFDVDLERARRLKRQQRFDEICWAAAALLALAVGVRSLLVVWWEVVSS